MSWGALDELTASAWSAFSPTQLAAITTAQLGAFTVVMNAPASVVNQFSAAQIQVLPTAAFSVASFDALDPSTIAEFTPKFMGLAAPAAIQGLSSAQFAAVTPAQIRRSQQRLLVRASSGS